MAKLNNIKKKILSLEDFNQYPIWTWDDSNEYQVPISETTPSWGDYDNFFIKARFITQGNYFDGYLIGIEHFYGFCLFIKNTEIVFNKNYSEVTKVNLINIFHLLECKPFKFFPIYYESSVRFKEGGIISRTLDFS